MKRILFPTDFSNSAHNAFDYACHFADIIGAELILLNVYNVPSSVKTSPELIDDLEKSSVNQLDDFINRYKELLMAEGIKSLNLKTDSVHGSIPESIVKYAFRQPIDLIIMGTGGNAGSSRDLEEVITCQVIHETKIPVLAIPEDYMYFPPVNILYAVDFKDTDPKAIHLIEEIANNFHAHIDLLHLVKQTEKNEQRYVNSRRTFLDLVSYQDWDYHSLISEDIIQSILEQVNILDSDCVVMKTRAKDWSQIDSNSPSLTELMCIHSTVPVLAIH